MKCAECGSEVVGEKAIEMLQSYVRKVEQNLRDQDCEIKQLRGSYNNLMRSKSRSQYAWWL